LRGVPHLGYDLKLRLRIFSAASISSSVAFIPFVDAMSTAVYLHHMPKADAAAKPTALIAAQMDTVSPVCPEPVTSTHSERNSEQLTAA
jgi:hypothetical protein